MNRIKKILTWTVAIILGLPAVCYLILILINWSDQAKSIQVLKYEAQIQQNEHSLLQNLTDNGYIYALGFPVAEDLRPKDWGLKRFKALIDTAFYAQLILGGKRLDLAAYRHGLSALLGDCHHQADITTECELRLASSTEHLSEWVDEHTWLLARYDSLLASPHWQDTTKSNWITVPLDHSALLAGQRLMLLSLYLKASNGEANLVTNGLEQDMRFWRHVSASTHSLATKMIAITAMENNLVWGGLALKQLPTKTILARIPPVWNEAFEGKASRLDTALLGEWQYFSSTLSQINSAQAIDELSPSQSLVQALLMPLLQPQDTRNRYSAWLHRQPGEMDETICPQVNSFSAMLGYAYNPMGKLLLCASKPAYIDYQLRAEQQEPHRLANLEEMSNMSSAGTDKALNR